MAKINTFKALVEACVEARKRFEREAVGYLEFLSTVERDYERLWKPNCGTFAVFLQDHVGLPRTSSYGEFKAALEAMGIAYVRACGAEAATQGCRIEDVGRRAEYERATAAWVKMHDGRHPSRETAVELRHKVDPKKSEARAVGQVRELEDLRAENLELRRRVHVLERENEKLRKQLGKNPPQPRA